MNAVKKHQTEKIETWERKKRCDHCFGDFIVNTKKPGRVPKYCSNRCKVKAYQKRKGLKPVHPLGLGSLTDKPLNGGLKKKTRGLKPNYGADIGTSTIGTGIALGVKELIRPSLTLKQLQNELQELKEDVEIMKEGVLLNNKYLKSLWEKLKYRY